MPLRQTPKGVYLHVRATPKAGRDEVIGIITNVTGQKSLGVKVTAVPEKGTANKAVIETLSDEMAIAKSSFRQSSGETSRDKIFEIVANEKTVRAYIAALTKD